VPDVTGLPGLPPVRRLTRAATARSARHSRWRWWRGWWRFRPRAWPGRCRCAHRSRRRRYERRHRLW